MARASITTERLILAAERLYADHGLDGISLRQIAEAAGQKNHASIQYHFGSKDALLRAIVRYRTEDAQEQRRKMLDELEASGRQHNVKSLIEAALIPLVKSQQPGSNYLRFIVALQPTALNDVWTEIGDEHGSTTRRIVSYLSEALQHIPPVLRLARINRAFDLMYRALAENVSLHGELAVRRIPDDLLLEELILSGVSVLEAPLPARAAQRLRRKSQLSSTSGPAPRVKSSAKH
jgi:AcrR family transcriptional regulator